MEHYLDWICQSREDRLLTPQFDYVENTYRFGLGQTFKTISIQAIAEFGNTENNLLHYQNNYHAEDYYRDRNIFEVRMDHTLPKDHLPENHYLETKILNLNLAPGEKKEILMRVLPRKRQIRILQDGGILTEEKKGK